MKTAMEVEVSYSYRNKDGIVVEVTELFRLLSRLNAFREELEANSNEFLEGQVIGKRGNVQFLYKEDLIAELYKYYIL